MESLRILLADPHPIFREAVKALLSARPGLQVTGEAGDGRETLARAHQSSPDVVLMDMLLPDCSGLEIIQLLKRELPRVRIIVTSLSNVESQRAAAVKNGVDAYLPTAAPPAQLFQLLDGYRRQNQTMHRWSPLRHTVGAGVAAE